MGSPFLITVLDALKLFLLAIGDVSVVKTKDENGENGISSQGMAVVLPAGILGKVALLLLLCVMLISQLRR